MSYIVSWMSLIWYWQFKYNHKGSSRYFFLFNFDNPYTIKYYKYTRSESTSKIFYTSIFRRLVLPFSVVNPPLLPINQTVNDHCFFVCANGINQNLFCIFQRDFRQAFNLLVKLVHHFTNFICQFRSLYFRKT